MSEMRERSNHKINLAVFWDKHNKRPENVTLFTTLQSQVYVFIDTSRKVNILKPESLLKTIPTSTRKQMLT